MYRKYTEDALKDGAFGLPYLVIKQEGQNDIGIFGSDRLPQICHILGKKYDGPLVGNASKL